MLACISLKRQLDSAFNQVSVVVLVIVLLALTVIFLISQLHRTIFEENKTEQPSKSLKLHQGKQNMAQRMVCRDAEIKNKYIT